MKTRETAETHHEPQKRDFYPPQSDAHAGRYASSSTDCSNTRSHRLDGGTEPRGGSERGSNCVFSAICGSAVCWDLPLSGRHTLLRSAHRRGRLSLYVNSNVQPRCLYGPACCVRIILQSSSPDTTQRVVMEMHPFFNTCTYFMIYLVITTDSGLLTRTRTRFSSYCDCEGMQQQRQVRSGVRENVEDKRVNTSRWLCCGAVDHRRTARGHLTGSEIS